MPGNVYDFKLFESNQLIWDYAIITEPAIPEYINMAELSPGMLKITFYLLIVNLSTKMVSKNVPK